MSQWNAQIKDQAQGPGQQRGTEDLQQRGRPGGKEGGGGAGPGKDMKAALNAARQLSKDRRHDEALAAFEAILKQHPDAAPAYMGLGNLHAGKGEYDKALEYYAGALHIKKDLAPALINSGTVYIKQGRLDKAIEKFKEAVQVNPSLSKAQLTASRIYAKLGKNDEAIASLMEALQHNPQLDEARLDLAAIYQRQGDKDAALHELNGIVSRDPENCQAQVQLARLHALRHDFKQAVNACKKAIDLKPESAPINYLLGRCYMSAGEYQLALRQFAKVSEIDAAMLPAKIGAARVNIELRKLPEARKILVGLSKGRRFLSVVHRLIAEVSMLQGENREAIAEFKAAILHGKKLTEKHPELLAVAVVAGDDRLTAEAYQRAFQKVDIDNTISSEPEGDAVPDEIDDVVPSAG